MMPETDLHRERPASLDAIDTAAHEAAFAIREAAPTIQTQTATAWNQFEQTMIATEGRWVSTYEAYKTFAQSLHPIWEGIPNESIHRVRRLAESRGPLDENWYILSSFLLHDIHHIDPSMLFTILHSVDNAHSKHGESFLFDRHKQFLSMICRRAGTFVETKALPLDFIQGVVALEQGRALPTEQFSPAVLIGRIARLIQGRFAMDDYDVHINETISDGANRNAILLDVPENLRIQTNKAMVFSVIYNLAKNAAKANAVAHHQEHDQAAHKAYYQGGMLEHPRNLTMRVEETSTQLIMSVADAGEGISIDASLERVQKIVASQLEHKGSAQIQQTEWYYQMRRALGEEQINFLMAWPSDPYALRKIQVGTIFDCQFVLGFGPEAWGIPSLTSGMGLWGVRYITERLQGNVMATNIFGGGALFTIFLPKQSVGLGL